MARDRAIQIEDGETARTLSLLTAILGSLPHALASWRST